MSPNVLIADDDESVRRLIERTLGGGGYRLLCASTGAEALDAARGARLDLVVLDKQMPCGDGLTVLAEIRRAGPNRWVPVILVSADDEPEALVRGLDGGADDYVTKPFAPAELAARVAGLLRRSRCRLGANPLTSLPGSPTMEEAVERRIAAGEPFAFLHADIDRFKRFNDAYGFAEGDRLILETAALLTRMVEALAPAGLVGHVGGDDFAVVCPPEPARRVAQLAASEFDRLAPSLGSPAAPRPGWARARAPFDAPRRKPIVALSVAGVATGVRDLAGYRQVVRIVDEMKARLKSRVPDGRSAWAFDRRGDLSAYGPGAAADLASDGSIVRPISG